MGIIEQNGGFVGRYLGDAILAMRVWQVTGRSAVESRFEALRATATPLVGRKEEVELLLRL
jgi:hypothetical protein